MPRTAYFRAKRVADFGVSAGILILALPILIVVGVIVTLTSPGSALYRARRVGQHGREFDMLKFRTMVAGADRVGPSVTAADDQRITGLGKLLRKTKIDELPQFWNVLCGDMSIVGPRPNDPRIVAEYTTQERHLLSVPQGITDYASLWFRTQENLLEGTHDVMADYHRHVAPVKARLGTYYADHGSLLADWKIFWATFLAVFLKVDPMWAFPAEATKTQEPMKQAA